MADNTFTYSPYIYLHSCLKIRAQSLDLSAAINSSHSIFIQYRRRHAVVALLSEAYLLHVDVDEQTAYEVFASNNMYPHKTLESTFFSLRNLEPMQRAGTSRLLTIFNDHSMPAPICSFVPNFKRSTQLTTNNVTPKHVSAIYNVSEWAWSILDTHESRAEYKIYHFIHLKKGCLICFAPAPLAVFRNATKRIEQSDRVRRLVPHRSLPLPHHDNNSAYVVP